MKTLQQRRLDPVKYLDTIKQQSLLYLSLAQKPASHLLLSLAIGLGLVSMTTLRAQAQQHNKANEHRILLKQAMLDIDRLNYDAAMQKLLDLNRFSNGNAHTDYLLGKCYLYSNTNNSFEKAAAYLNKAAESINPDYEFWVLNETQAPIDVLYHMGKAYEKLEFYEEATASLNAYLDLLARKNDSHLARAQSK
jgi:tRNA A37 threonylcarbamoyladenosine modification protein TsaB